MDRCSAGLGVAGFIVGFALQETLGNFAAGVMILIYRPFDVGDYVEAGGVFGSVQKMTLVSTTILMIDNQTLIVPNSKIWGTSFAMSRAGEAARRPGPSESATATTFPRPRAS